MRRDYNQLFPSLQYSSRSISPNFFNQPVTNCSSMRKRIANFKSDAIEIQAIAILWLARTEMEEQLNKSSSSVASSSLSHMQFHLHSTSRGLSLKKSLHKFLQRRKERIRRNHAL